MDGCNFIFTSGTIFILRKGFLGFLEPPTSHLPSKDIVIHKVQLNKWQTDPYFFQNFQCNTMLIHAFCKTSDQKIVFVLTFVVFSRLYSIGNFVIQLHTCLQRGFDSILQYLNFTFLSHFLFWFVEQLYGRNSDKTRE